MNRSYKRGSVAALGWLAPSLLLLAFVAGAQPAAQGEAEENGTVQLDFNDVELSVVIDTIAQLTQKNFIYDDRVRGRVTIVSPTKITKEEAYAVFESVLQVKGFTTVETPGGAMKVIPIREAKESNVETVRGKTVTPDSDRFVTRLIPLRFIDAEAITNTVKPLVSKDASMVAYPPTNTVILTDSASNIRRILNILQSIDVETYKEELTVIQVRHADANTLADQLSTIFDADVSSAAGQPVRARARRAAQPTPTVTTGAASKGAVRIITDERTNSLIVLASRQRIGEIREVIQRLDVPVVGGGRIHVYYLKHADAEELANTLSGLISGQPAASSGGAGGAAGRAGAAAAANPALRAAITELADGVTVTADAPTNSLVIQATKEGYSTLAQVIAQLDIPRPQVLVEALIMEVDVSDNQALGFNGLARIFRGSTSYGVGSLTGSGRGALVGALPSGVSLIDDDMDPLTPPVPGGSELTSGATATDILGSIGESALSNLVAAASRNTLDISPEGQIVGGSLIQGIITASADLGGTNILSAPHILTMDNEEAEIKVGANIPIVTSRVQSAAGQDTGLSTSQNIERQDIGITLRVTPQISEGNNLRLQIFQEITDVNTALSAVTGDPQEVGVSLSNRTIQNVVVVADNETVVIGGLISDDFEDTESKVPWLGDIPVLGWLFKTKTKSVQKQNLLVFLTPRIVRNEAELASTTIRKREEFWESSEQALRLTDKEKEEAKKRRADAEAAGIPLHVYRGRNPVRGRLVGHREKYPVERMREIEIEQRELRERGASEAAATAATTYGVLAATFGDEGAAAATLQQLLDAGYDGTLIAEDRSGTVLYELHIGPFVDMEQAETAAEVMRQSFELSPVITVRDEE